MGTCLWNLNSKSYWHCPHHQRQLLTSTPWTEFAGWHHNHWPWTYNGFFESIYSFLQVFNFDDFRYPQSVVITDFSDIFGTSESSEHQYCTALPFVISLTSLSNSCALTLPRDTIFTKHQALAPSSPMLLQSNPRWVRLEFCCKASARACQETHHMTWEVRWSTQHTRSVKLRNSFTFAFVFQIGQHHHLLARKHSFSGLLVFEL